MTERDQINAFHADLTALIGRYISEFNPTTASAVGVMA